LTVEVVISVAILKDGRINEERIAGTLVICIMHFDLQWMQNCVGLIQGQHGLCHIAQLINDCIADSRNAPNNANRQQRD